MSMSQFVPPGLGWRQSLPDFRDYGPQSPPVRRMLERLAAIRTATAPPPEQVDLREYFPEVGDQQQLHSSTAHACSGVLDYYQRRVHGKVSPPSSLFLYKTTRRLLGVPGDGGADFRSTFKALVQFGVPPERHWPYRISRFDQEPDAFLYGYAQQYRSLCYVRLDGRQGGGAETLERVRAFLAAGFPVLFGLSVPSLISRDGDIPYHPATASVLGGQALVAVGYNDRRMRVTRGALLVRNSWGPGWGEGGYGWLPYCYVAERLAVEFWVLLRPDWLESAEFEPPRLVES